LLYKENDGLGESAPGFSLGSGGSGRAGGGPGVLSMEPGRELRASAGGAPPGGGARRDPHRHVLKRPS